MNERLSKRVDAEIDDGSGSEFVFHLPDALGSTRDVVDSSGNVIRSNEWDEYGNLISSWSSGTGAATPKTWIGGLSVNDDTADSGLWNMGHRNYAGGVLGRFISRDPIGFNGSSMNLYAYPTNPVSFVDPDGREPYAPLNESRVLDYLNEKYRMDYKLREISINRNDFNCFAFAVGRSIPDQKEDALNARGQFLPNPNQPQWKRWNSHPANELKQNYDLVTNNRFQVGDTIIYGRDVDGHPGINMEFYPVGRGIVSDITHAAVVTDVSRDGQILRCQSKPGSENYLWDHSPTDPKVLQTYGMPTYVFRPKLGVSPQRVWSRR